MEFVVISKGEGTPSVSLERRILKTGEHQDTFTLLLITQRMFVDLEHEIDHIDQIITRFLAQGIPFFTVVLEENNRGFWQENPHYPGVLRNWQNTIAEYHVRLLEFKRLYNRGIDEKVLRDHARQVIIWSNKYYNATGLGKSKTKKYWEVQHFADLHALREEVNQLFLQTGFLFTEWEVAKNPYQEVKLQ